MTKFTPGPWEAHETSTTNIDIYTSPYKWVATALGTHVGIQEDQVKHNARLIAAAPEMFALLETMLGSSPGWREAVGLLEDHCGDEAKLKNMTAALDQIDECNKSIHELINRINQ